MIDAESLILSVTFIVVPVCVVVTIALRVVRGREKCAGAAFESKADKIRHPSPALVPPIPGTPAPPPGVMRLSAHGTELWNTLMMIALHDLPKAGRLIQIEADELKRKGETGDNLEDLMERAVERWQRENAG
jgi:hypothetical protein